MSIILEQDLYVSSKSRSSSLKSIICNKICIFEVKLVVLA